MTTNAFREARACACGDHGFVGLTFGLVALVDADDVPSVAHSKWCVTVSGGYAFARREGRMHRFIVNAATGTQVDHRNRDRLDNRRANLRECTHTQNCHNSGARKPGRFKGVYLERTTGRYYAQIRANGRRECLGTFSTAEEAAAAYDEAATRLHGEFAFTNAMTFRWCDMAEGPQ